MKWSPGPIPMATRCCLPPHRSQSTAVFTARSATIRLRILRQSPSFPGFHCSCSCRTRCRPNRSWSSWPMQRHIRASSHWHPPGTGSTPHLAGELLKQMAGIEMTHVPYRGASAALNDLIPGRVDCYFGSGALLENMRSGQLHGLAVTGAKRDPVAPELPTMAEAGVPSYEVSSWHGLFVPARTPPEIVKKMSV